MALQVWMPFTDGTLKQQGLKNVSPTIGGTVDLTSVGKLGKCATIGTAAGGITLPASSMTSFTECSVAFWIKIISWNTSYATFFQAGLGSTPWNNYIFGILRNNAGSNLCFTLTNSSGTSSSAAYTTSNLNIGQWYHLAFTYKAGTVRTYIDGVLDKTYSTTYVPNFAGITHISIGRSTNNSGYQTNCNLNDFRIYDHCLSPMEIKQLSQGLVLHYPLDRQGFGQENLLLNSTIPTSGSGASGITKYITDDGLQKVVAASGNGNWCTFGNHNTTLALTKGDTFTFSMMIKSDDSIKKPTVYFQSGLGYYSMQGTMSSNWSIIYYTGIWSIDNLTTNIHLGFSGAPGTYYIKYFKIEKGDKVTPWAPNHTDEIYTTMGFNSTTEYDCSGFCNNGTRTGTFEWTSNTPKYAVSQVFNGSNNAIQTPSLPTMITDKNYTIAVWIYKTVIGSKGYQTIYGGPSGFEIEARNGSANETKFVPWNWGKPMASYELNEWNHCVFVHSDSDCKIYLNGEYIATGTAKTSNPTGNYFIGAWNTATQQNFDGLMSDFRIYATALSAEDVKSLYQNCATIDPDGTIRGQIRS